MYNRCIINIKNLRMTLPKGEGRPLRPSLDPQLHTVVKDAVLQLLLSAIRQTSGMFIVFYHAHASANRQLTFLAVSSHVKFWPRLKFFSCKPNTRSVIKMCNKVTIQHPKRVAIQWYVTYR